MTVKQLIFCILISLAGAFGACVLISLASCKVIQRKEVAPLIEQRVAQYNNSSRIINIHGGGEEIIYTIAVKRDSVMAKDLINKK